MSKRLVRTVTVESGSKRQRTMSPYRRKVRKSKGSTKYRDRGAKVPETKFNDTDISMSVGPTGGTGAVNLVAIAQGTDFNQRIGRQIRMKSLHYKLGVSALASSLNTGATYPLAGSNLVRIAIVNDKQNNGAGAPNAGLVWTITGSTDQLAPTRMRNLNYIDRFDVLADDLVVINAGGPIGQMVSKYIKLDLPCAYNVTTGGFSVTNNLFLFVIDMNQTGTLVTSCYGEVRLNYFDD